MRHSRPNNVTTNRFNPPIITLLALLPKSTGDAMDRCTGGPQIEIDHNAIICAAIRLLDHELPIANPRDLLDEALLLVAHLYPFERMDEHRVDGIDVRQIWMQQLVPREVENLDADHGVRRARFRIWHLHSVGVWLDVVRRAPGIEYRVFEVAYSIVVRDEVCETRSVGRPPKRAGAVEDLLFVHPVGNAVKKGVIACRGHTNGHSHSSGCI